MTTFYSHAFYLVPVRKAVHEIETALWNKSTHLDMSRLELTGWADLPSRFRSIDLSNNALRSIPTMHAPLTHLDLSNNKLKTIAEGDLPLSLEVLVLNENEITEISWLPPHLKELRVRRNKLTRLCAAVGSQRRGLRCEFVVSDAFGSSREARLWACFGKVRERISEGIPFSKAL